MRKASLFLAGLVALAAAPLAASASDLSYRYAEGGYQQVDSSVNSRGVYVRGAYEFGQTGVYALGSYADLSNDGFDVNPRPAELGAGYHYNFSPRLHGIGEVAYQRTHTRYGNVEGWRGSVGVRGQFSDTWEGLAKVNYYDRADYRGDTTGTVGVQYRITPVWGLAGEVEFDNRDQSYQVGVRASF